MFDHGDPGDRPEAVGFNEVVGRLDSLAWRAEHDPDSLPGVIVAAVGDATTLTRHVARHDFMRIIINRDDSGVLSLARQMQSYRHRNGQGRLALERWTTTVELSDEPSGTYVSESGFWHPDGQLADAVAGTVNMIDTQDDSYLRNIIRDLDTIEKQPSQLTRWQRLKGVLLGDVVPYEPPAY